MEDHDGEGLVDKYFVLKMRGEGPPDIHVEGINNSDGCISIDIWSKRSWCFVLSPEKRDRYGFASRAALMTYASTIEKVNPKLANDIRIRLNQILKQQEEERVSTEEDPRDHK